MSKFLLELDIEQKLDRLKRSSGVGFGIFVMTGIVIIDAILLIISIILRITGNLLAFYSSTIPIVIFTFYNVVVSYKLNKINKENSKLRRNLNKEINWLADYDKMDEDRLYEQFIEISEAKLPSKRR